MYNNNNDHFQRRKIPLIFRIIFFFLISLSLSAPFKFIQLSQTDNNNDSVYLDRLLS